jgi:hypothetical protein
MVFFHLRFGEDRRTQMSSFPKIARCHFGMHSSVARIGFGTIAPRYLLPFWGVSRRPTPRVGADAPEAAVVGNAACVARRSTRTSRFQKYALFRRFHESANRHGFRLVAIPSSPPAKGQNNRQLCLTENVGLLRPSLWLGVEPPRLVFHSTVFSVGNCDGRGDHVDCVFPELQVHICDILESQSTPAPSFIPDVS